MSSLLVYPQVSRITEQDCYDFYNHFKTRELPHAFYLESKASMLEFCLDTTMMLGDSLFTTADIQFIIQQIKYPVLNQWEPGKIKNATIIDSRELRGIFKHGVDGWDDFHKKYGHEGYYNLSPPFFSIKGDRCMIYMSQHCGGLCGAGEIYFCKKVGKKWIVILRSQCWIS